jgi:hypothetical protein
MESMFRLISFTAHAAVELAVGLVIMAAPFVLGFGPAGTAAAVVIGVLVVGLALNAATTEGSNIPIAAHFAFDRGLAAGLLGAALLLALAGDRAAGTFFFAAAAAQLALNLSTRYTAPAS